MLVQDKNSNAARIGAGIAIKKANAAGNGKVVYKIEVRDMEGPWGTGAKESVNLVFEKDVCAVIGAIDGRNSHLAEQVSAKTRVPFISACSGDPTLGQAFIPWFFSCVPNDLQTAEILLTEIDKRGLRKIILLHDNSYDAGMAASSFMRKYQDHKGISIENIAFNSQKDTTVFMKKAHDTDCVIFFGGSSALAPFLKQARQINPSVTFFAPYILMEEKISSQLKHFDNVETLNPGNFTTSPDNWFTVDYYRITNSFPSGPAGYACDAVNIIIDALKKAGDDRTVLFRRIAESNQSGLTGKISFDPSGNRKEFNGFLKIKNGGFEKED
ncbi:MAG TPA: ABC transporter substrate-binding protein [Bacteroidales bacterium]|nr:ABC transporter substrate-binding protein [Bacteroidales bacterium]